MGLVGFTPAVKCRRAGSYGPALLVIRTGWVASMHASTVCPAPSVPHSRELAEPVQAPPTPTPARTPNVKGGLCCTLRALLELVTCTTSEVRALRPKGAFRFRSQQSLAPVHQAPRTSRAACVARYERCSSSWHAPQARFGRSGRRARSVSGAGVVWRRFFSPPERQRRVCVARYERCSSSWHAPQARSAAWTEGHVPFQEHGVVWRRFSRPPNVKGGFVSHDTSDARARGMHHKPRLRAQNA